ncbi:MAG: MFS transporter [bacterium]
MSDNDAKAKSDIFVKEQRGLKFILRAFNYRNYRLYFSGQSISLIGTWMQIVAMSWLVYRLTNSAFLLGLLGFVSQLPTLLVMPFAGVLVDRYDRRKLLIGTQVLAMIQALILSLLVFVGVITVRQIIPLSIFLGIVGAVDAPTRQSFVIEVVEKKEDLTSAISLNSAMFNGARMIGPSIAGIVVAAFGEGVCFLLNALSFLAVIFCLFAMRIKPRKVKTISKNMFHDLKMGFKYAYGSLPIRSIILYLGFVSLIGMSYFVLMPIFARDILHGGPRTLGFLMASTGVGALGGVLFLASRKNVIQLFKIIVFSGLIFGSSIIFFSFSRYLWLSLILLVFTGFGMMTQMASCNTLVQTIVEDDKRGRVMSLYTTAFMGMMPIGALITGTFASLIGAPYTMIINGLSCLIASLVFARKVEKLRSLSHLIIKDNYH